jgi:hypothetical protein
MLPEVSITKMTYSLSTGNAADRLGAAARARLALQQPLTSR